ncbi:diacylglycerol/lipid kinase family protein [Pengzhenrongella sicca]|uniref:Diacylglycerol kinase family lipid kinase n=1 Tax=Pengzhenrongella sicca TaxID=2819238 RepID=A0A8A4ZBH3_9MICO|nr:diacylglycerol kinase family protein [Pengzhenrongella sicca]QTE27837.1 diacylglycerol kinase family lipid kinase [Pengzhenrongella sicca]
MSHLGVVINPTAGRGRGSDVGAQALAVLRRRGHTVEDLSAPSLTEATARARHAAVAGLDAIVVVGGDGMTHLGVNVVADTDLPLGIVPGGTGNDIARSLGLPHGDVAAAVAAIEHGLAHGPRRIDAVSAGPPEHSAREWFVGVLSCGFDAAVNARANSMTWPGGSARYVRAIAAELGRFAPYGYRLTLDDAVWESAGTLVAVANSPVFGGGVRIAPDALMDDGLLDVVVAGPFTKPGIVGIFPGMYRGRHLRHPAVQVFRSTTVLIEPILALGAHPPAAFADGERLGPLPLRATLHPAALSVLT